VDELRSPHCHRSDTVDELRSPHCHRSGTVDELRSPHCHRSDTVDELRSPHCYKSSAELDKTLNALKFYRCEGKITNDIYFFLYFQMHIFPPNYFKTC
jgi:hypothetical protein